LPKKTNNTAKRISTPSWEENLLKLHHTLCVSAYPVTKNSMNPLLLYTRKAKLFRNDEWLHISKRLRIANEQQRNPSRLAYQDYPNCILLYQFY
jgi:hypothetical protein